MEDRGRARKTISRRREGGRNDKWSEKKIKKKYDFSERNMVVKYFRWRTNCFTQRKITLSSSVPEGEEENEQEEEEQEEEEGAGREEDQHVNMGCKHTNLAEVVFSVLG